MVSNRTWPPASAGPGGCETICRIRPNMASNHPPLLRGSHLTARGSRPGGRHHVARSANARAAAVLLVMCALGVATATTFSSGALNKAAAWTAQLPPRDATVRLVPEDSGHGVAPEASGRAGQGRRGVAAFHDFQFTDRLSRERHHLQAPHRRRRRQDVQGGALRSRQRPRDRRRRRRRPLRHLLREPGRRQPAVEECRRRQVPGHHGVGRRGGAGQGRRLGVVRRHRQRRRRGPLRHDRPRRQHAVRERRQRPLPRHHRGLRPQLRRPLVGRRVLRLQPRRPARPVPRQRRTVHDEHDRRRRLQVLRRRSRTRSPAT